MPENVENVEEVVVEAETSELADEKAASNGHTPKAAQATAGATDAQPAEAETGHEQQRKGRTRDRGHQSVLPRGWQE